MSSSIQRSFLISLIVGVVVALLCGILIYQYTTHEIIWESNVEYVHGTFPIFGYTFELRFIPYVLTSIGVGGVFSSFLFALLNWNKYTRRKAISMDIISLNLILFAALVHAILPKICSCVCPE